MTATKNSKRSATRTGICARSTTSTTPTTTSDRVCPRPHGAASTRISLAPEVRLFWFTGIFGGFTTFSSYAFESFALVREGHVLAAGANIVGQVVLGLVALGFAYAVAANN